MNVTSLRLTKNDNYINQISSIPTHFTPGEGALVSILREQLPGLLRSVEPSHHEAKEIKINQLKEHVRECCSIMNGCHLTVHRKSEMESMLMRAMRELESLIVDDRFR